jgi:hypothetical protein|tara:strand:- start:1101 stop:1223 length:123 start_codon:yes stop_codon:yes gene_type:complete
MRGSLTVNDSYDLATEDIELMNDLIKENMETAKKTGQPFF